LCANPVNPLLVPVHQILKHRIASRDVRPKFRTYGFSSCRAERT
jgi:hypothetical protein